MKLNLGSGKTRFEGFTNVDSYQYGDVDIVHNLNNIPWPFEDESIEEIIAQDILEHLYNTTDIMTEIWRILKPNRTIKIRVPNVLESQYMAFTDPTHVKYFTKNSFDYWDPNTEHGKKYSYYLKTNNIFYIIDKKVSDNLSITLKKGNI